MKTFRIDNDKELSLTDLRQITFNPVQLTLTQNAIRAITRSTDYLDCALAEGTLIYGVNTGFGKLANIRIPETELCPLQKNLLLSHAAGCGPLLDNTSVRLILALKIQSLARGYSACRLETVEALIRFFNAAVYPCVPAQGSVGASGDLAPLAHLSLSLLGVGRVNYQNKMIPAAKALQELQMKPLELAPKEGLALINGTQVSTALALHAFFRLENIFAAALVSGVLSTLAIGADADCFDDRIQRIRKQSGQITVAAHYRHLLRHCRYELNQNFVQSPYSFRCQPQVMGACLDQMRHAADILAREASAVTDNPLLFTQDRQFLFGGNFHAEPVALAADNLALVFAETGSLAERRMAALLDASFSGLPAFLADNPGLHSGLMTLQVTAAALVSENKALAHPASVDSIPTSANQEDHVSMATFAARRLHTMADNLAAIIALELIIACKAIRLSQRVHRLNKKLEKVVEKLSSFLRFQGTDQYLGEAIAQMTTLVETNFFSDL